MARWELKLRVTLVLHECSTPRHLVASLKQADEKLSVRFAIDWRGRATFRSSLVDEIEPVHVSKGTVARRICVTMTYLIPFSLYTLSATSMM